MVRMSFTDAGAVCRLAVRATKPLQIERSVKNIHNEREIAPTELHKHTK